MLCTEDVELSLVRTDYRYIAVVCRIIVGMVPTGAVVHHWAPLPKLPSIGGGQSGGKQSHVAPAWYWHCIKHCDWLGTSCDQQPAGNPRHPHPCLTIITTRSSFLLMTQSCIFSPICFPPTLLSQTGSPHRTSWCMNAAWLPSTMAATVKCSGPTCLERPLVPKDQITAKNVF